MSYAVPVSFSSSSVISEVSFHFFLALPPSFAEFAILGYIDFASILLAIGITIIATGISATDAPGGLAAVTWELWPAAETSFYEAFLSITDEATPAKVMQS